ncbi:MAG: penicillin-binding protein [Termitinemataceae bacterium]|nr:MAG: penicillin-binding protein [Termitinemataceae bacterium]
MILQENHMDNNSNGVDFETHDGKNPDTRLRRILFLVLLAAASIYVIANYAVLMLGSVPPKIPTARITADRGQILDRNGRILAIQTRLGNISAWKPGIKSVEDTARYLSPLLQMSENEIIDKINLSSSDFIYLKKQVDRQTLTEIEKLLKGRIVSGVNIEPVMGRIYPEDELASQIIGFVGAENFGLAGIEYAFNDELKAKPAKNESGGVAGNKIVLSIDMNVQYILEERAQAALEQNEAETVMLVALNPRTGDILGSASRPGFDPNNFNNSDEKNRMNRPASLAYEPGSVFKIFSLAALLDGNAITPQSIFLCNGKYEKITRDGQRHTITCLGAHGQVTARDIITYSCNAGAAYASDRSGTNDFYDALVKLGFGKRTGLGIPGETAGFLRPTDRWSPRSKPTIAMGQEIAVSALQMMQAATAIANDGLMVTPKIVLRITDENGKTVRELPRSEPVRVFKAETAREMRSYMSAVASSIGTGRRAIVDDMPLAVKTGTAQMANPVTGRYSDTDFIASCMAILPVESPSLIIYGVIIRPKGESYLGGRIAAPLIRETAEDLVNYLGIPRGRNPQISHTGRISLPDTAIPIVGDIVPNLSGYSKRQLLPLLLRDDLHIEIRGDGWVKSQRPAAGTPITENTVIVLMLE